LLLTLRQNLAVEEPVPTDELGFLSTISTKITNVIDTITSLPENVANAISNKFTTVSPGDSIDFTKLRVAGDLFTSKFPFCLPWDLKNMIFNVWGRYDCCAYDTYSPRDNHN